MSQGQYLQFKEKVYTIVPVTYKGFGFYDIFNEHVCLEILLFSSAARNPFWGWMIQILCTERSEVRVTVIVLQLCVVCEMMKGRETVKPGAAHSQLLSMSNKAARFKVSNPSGCSFENSNRRSADKVSSLKKSCKISILPLKLSSFPPDM